MKKFLCFALLLTLLLSACGRTPAQPTEPAGTAAPTKAPESTPKPTPAPTPTPEPTPEPEPDDPLERALAFLQTRDKDYVQRHVGTYLELYRMSHPGADVQVTGWTTDAQGIHMNLTGLEAADFAEADYFPDLVEFSSVISGNTFVREDLPVPREPESDHLSERGMRITMDRADWPVGAEYIRFTLTNETEDYLSYNEICLQKAVEGLWHNVRLAGGSIGSAWVLEPHASVTWVMPVQFLYPRLGEGLYRVYLPHEKDWAEFAVRAEEEPMDPEPMDPEYLICRNWPEAALLLAGMPEKVESDLAHVVHWPAVSHHWRLTEDRSLSDEGLAQRLLGEEAEYDAAAAVWRAGTLTLSLGDKVRVVNDSLLSMALQLALPLRGPETLDPRKIPSLEEAGWTLGGFWTELDAGIGDLYPGLNSRCFIPDIGILNERLEAALERLEDEDPRYTELADFRFAPEDAGDLRLVLISLRTVTPEVGINAWPVVSPWGELEETAVWYVSDESLGILLLEGQYPGSCLESYDSGETVSPMEQIEKFLPLMEGEEEGLRLTRMDYVLIPGNEEGVFQPAWRLLAETASGEERTWVVSARTKKQSAYDLQRRAYLQNLQREIRGLFQRYREQHPDMDVWEDSWVIDLLEGGRECLVVLCHGADIPALEASGVLPEGVVLDWIESPFNQKESHPCPHEPEWEKDWGTVRFAMGQAEYPPYPGSVELTVGWEKTFQLQSLVCKKHMDGEWRTVCRVYADGQELEAEAGETTLQATLFSRLGPGLYRLYINEKFWVEFKVTDRTAEN